MVVRLFACAILPALLLGAPAKKQTVGSGRGENEDMILSVTLYTAPADVKELIGDDLGGHYIVAEVKVEPKYGKTLTIDDLIAHCRQTLANYKIPRRVEFSETELPKSGTGKVLKRMLRERFWPLQQRAVS